MAKKFGKFLMVTAALGAVAAGVYYYLQGKDNFVDDNFDDDDDFDNFNDDLDDEGTAQDADRNYVDLDLEKADEFKEGLNAAKAEAGGIGHSLTGGLGRFAHCGGYWSFFPAKCAMEDLRCRNAAVLWRGASTSRLATFLRG